MIYNGKEIDDVKEKLVIRAKVREQVSQILDNIVQLNKDGVLKKFDFKRMIDDRNLYRITENDFKRFCDIHGKSVIVVDGSIKGYRPSVKGKEVKR